MTKSLLTSKGVFKINIQALRKANETPKAYRIRLYKNKDLYELNNVEIGKLCNDAFGVNWTESAHRKHTQNYLKGYNDAKSELGTVDQQLQNMINENKTLKREIQREKIKIQTEKIEYNRWQRELARDELINEQINNTISSLKPLEIPEIRGIDIGKKEYVLCYGDAHLGAEFEIKGLLGQTLNEYSPEIFEKRMWNLSNEIVNIVRENNISTLHIWDMGDAIDGMLRVSQLWKLRYGVVEQTINYAEFISNWLNHLSKVVNIKFQMIIDANHSQLRQLGQPKNTFKDDNMSKIIISFIKARLENNPNIKIIENPTGMIFDTLCNYNIVGVHGEIKNLESALRELSDIHSIKINYLIAGHLHHGKYEEIGMDMEVINIPSIIGIDDFSLSLRKTSNPGAKLFIFEENKGKKIEHNIKL